MQQRQHFAAAKRHAALVGAPWKPHWRMPAALAGSDTHSAVPGAGSGRLAGHTCLGPSCECLGSTSQGYRLAAAGAGAAARQAEIDRNTLGGPEEQAHRKVPRHRQIHGALEEASKAYSSQKESSHESHRGYLPFRTRYDSLVARTC